MDCPTVPSLWPPRKEKRHLAQTRAFDTLNGRLSVMESAIKELAMKVDGVANKLISLTDTSATSASHPTEVCSDKSTSTLLDDMQSRIEKIELLLLRTSIQEFQCLDSDILKILPRCVSSIATKQEASAEELSIAAPAQASCVSSASTCLNFDIYSEPGDLCNYSEAASEGIVSSSTEGTHLQSAHNQFEVGIADPNNEKGFLAKAWEIAEKIQSESHCLCSKGQYDDYVKLVELSFGNLLIMATRFPTMTLSVDSFTQEYGELHSRAIWKNMCKRYHDGDENPSNKSIAFAELVSILDCLWTT